MTERGFHDLIKVLGQFNFNDNPIYKDIIISNS